jgi:hypothetical protein
MDVGTSRRRQDGGVCVALGGRLTETCGDERPRDDVRWPAVAATLRGRGRVCAALSVRTRLHRMASEAVVRVQVYTFFFFYSKTSGVSCTSYAYPYGASAHMRLAHGWRTCFLFPCFYRGRSFFSRKTGVFDSRRAAPCHRFYCSVGCGRGRGCRQARARERSERGRCASGASAKKSHFFF